MARAEAQQELERVREAAKLEVHEAEAKAKKAASLEAWSQARVARVTRASEGMTEALNKALCTVDGVHVREHHCMTSATVLRLVTHGLRNGDLPTNGETHFWKDIVKPVERDKPTATHRPAEAGNARQ